MLPVGGTRKGDEDNVSTMAKVLIADDEPALRTFVGRALEIGGHKVTSVADGAAALQALSEEDDYDLLLTDIVMPIMDGVALALKVARDYPDLKILMMTGYAREKDRAHNLDVLVHDIIVKPFSMDEITLKVREALQS